MPRSRLVLLAVFCGLLGAFILGQAEHDHALLDDAYISCRYAARWAEGKGLTFNDGEVVEGFSNPLWTLTLGLGARLGVPPHQSAPIMGLGALLALLPVVRLLLRRRGLDGRAAWFALAIVFLDVGLPIWAGSGLETVSATLLAGGYLAVAARPPSAGRGSWGAGLGLGLLGAGLALSRPEGVLLAGWGMLWLVWGVWASRTVLAGALLGSIPYPAYLVFRWFTYGRLLPNTFFAKLEPSFASFGPGLLALARWAGEHAVLGIPILFLAAQRLQPRRLPPGSTLRWWFLPAGWVVLQAGFVVAVGGDWMGDSRYMLPVLPALAILGGELAAGAQIPRVRGAGWALAGLFVVHLGLGLATRDRIPNYTTAGRAVGLWLRTVAEPTDTLAVTAAGAIPYFSGLPALDVLGLNDARVAHTPVRHTSAWAPGHHRYDIDWLLECRPRWVVWDYGVKLNERRLRDLRGQPGPAPTLDYRKALLARPEFTQAYVIEYSAPGQETYTVFRRRGP